MSKAKEINEACIEAVLLANTDLDFDEDHNELVAGRTINVASLHKQGLQAVLSYWISERTLGGSLLWDTGYYVELPEAIQSIFDNVTFCIPDNI